MSEPPAPSPQEVAAKFAGAYVYASWVIDGTIFVGVVEGVTAAVLLMRLRRHRPAHWFARPLAWSISLVGLSVAGAKMNIAWLQSLLSDHQTRSVWGIPTELIPSVVGLAIVLAWIAYGLDLTRRVLSRRRRQPKKSGQPRHIQQPKGRGNLLERLCVSSGVIMMVADFAWITYMIHALSQPSPVNVFRFALLGSIGALTAGFLAVQFLWAGREAWGQRK